ncbi:hypothetical protein N7539_001688 [Penicillium diatomitis]|uniref:Peroxin domain-containing protein n=1 Tax=Penicillium diatomitis TaxID=2819901 RepID=A0A9W9XH59_9EURO|nr:uncharacterized protein N7539_001688 [Penicillium diatomitis]KAJ5492942.1 hypothetical protein N7539_001688 [Penicillium diatomitis]
MEDGDKIPTWNSVTEPGPPINAKVQAGYDNAERNEPEGPTDSHVLSQVEPEEKGIIQKMGDTNDISDVGWTNLEHHREQLIAGLSNEDAFMLIRRFNKQVYNVKAVSKAPLQNLDLTRTDEDEFSPDKLRATIERFYTTVVVKLTSGVKHIARLRSWREPRRTAAFCAVYAIAWLLDLLLPTFFAGLILLIVYTPARAVMFPPAPIALVNKDTGGVQKPKAGMLGSKDSITGAPQSYKGEAAEREASNLVAGIASVAVGSAVGKHEQGVPDEAPLEDDVPDASEMVFQSADAQSKAHGHEPSEHHDKTRQPMKQSVMEGANMMMSIVTELTDTFEKFENALSPTPPFPIQTPRLRLAAALVPACILSLCTSVYVFHKVAGLGVGLGFFGDPLINRGLAILNEKYPHWQRLLKPQNSILKGIPTNAQLTLTLLRIGEKNASPLPPPPSSHPHDTARRASIKEEERTLAATDAEIDHAATPQAPQEPANSEDSSEAPRKKSLGSKIVGFFRGTTRTGVESKQAVDRARAVVGSHHAKNRIGVLHTKGAPPTPIGPTKFSARYKGHRGAVILDSTMTPPTLYFTTDVPESDDISPLDRKKGSVLFSMPISDIQEMKKLGGMGWKGKLVVGWAIGEKEVMDGILLGGKYPGQSYRLTAMKMRNELFNRLIAIDGQVWESF